MIKIPMPKSVKFREAVAWCVEQFGPFKYEPNVVSRWDYHNGKITFYFRDQADVMLFLLRWS